MGEREIIWKTEEFIIPAFLQLSKKKKNLMCLLLCFQVFISNIFAQVTLNLHYLCVSLFQKLAKAMN